MANPLGATAEAQGEWFELVAVSGGELGGIALTDNDGERDFVFPEGNVTAGETLLVANGQSAPPGAAKGARVFLAAKSWWTLDDAGDDLAVVSPDGSVQDHLRYGSGPAVDNLTAQEANGSALPAAPPKGASVGRWGNEVRALVPTPGAPNRPLSTAGDASVRLAGLLQVGNEAAPLFCAAGVRPFNPYLWSLAVGTDRVVIDEDTPATAPCLVFGASFGDPWVSQAAALFGSSLQPYLLHAAFAWKEGDEVELRDPSEAVVGSTVGPSEATNGSLGAALLTPCACIGGWLVRPLWRVQPQSPPRAVGDVQVVRAGPELEGALAAFFSSASFTLDVNAYLLTAGSVEDALRKAAQRGVSVRLLLEGAPVGAPAQSTALGDAAMAAFNQSGVWVRKFNTSSPNPARDHAKYAVADGVSVAVLTENFVGAALTAEAPNVGFAVFLRSQALGSDLEAVFSSDFSHGRNASLMPRSLRAAAPASNDISSWSARGAVLLSPGVSTGPWVEAIGSAKSTVEVMSLSADMATIGPGSPLGDALLAACRRGASVRILFSSAFEDASNSTSLATASALAAAAFCPTFEVRMRPGSGTDDALLHAKVLVIDGTRFILGSHNLVAPAFGSNRELSLLIEDNASAALLEASFSSEFAKGSPVAASPVDLEEGSALGSDEGATAPAPSGPGSFEILAFGGGAVTAFAHVRGRRRVRAAPKREPFWRKSAWSAQPTSTRPASPDPLALALLPDDDEARDAPQPREPPFELRASPPALAPPPMPAPRVMPPTAFELFDGR